MKPVKLTSAQWTKILYQLHEEYPPSYFLRYKMKEKLGFTVREHKAWIENKDYKRQHDNWASSDPSDMFHDLSKPSQGRYEEQIHLDFYNRGKRDFFLLKFSEIISGARDEDPLKII